jgi:hypothetical protein
LATNEQLINAIEMVLSAMVLQLVDLNSCMGDLVNRVTISRSYYQAIVEELRTLNASIGRVEDHMSYRP